MTASSGPVASERSRAIVVPRYPAPRVTIQFFAVGQEATGVIAVGQLATGFIAIGQGATGVIAIGQMARGVVAVGMLSVGIVSVGMLSFGLAYSVGMIGAGGKGGGGLILPLVPVLPKRPKLPGLGSLRAILEGRGAGWLRGQVERAGAAFGLRTEGQLYPLEVPAGLEEGAGTAADGRLEVVALVERAPAAPATGPSSGYRDAPAPGASGPLALRRLMRARAEAITPQWLGIAAAQLVGLTVGAYLYFQFVLVDLVDMLFVLYRAA